MRAHQTGNYLDFKGEFERALSTVENNGAKHYRLNLDVTTPDNSRSAGTFKTFEISLLFIGNCNVKL